MELSTRSITPGRWVGGGLLIALGVVFLLMNIGFIERFSIWSFWPVILMAVGIAKMFQPFQRAEGFWLFAIGAWFQWSLLEIGGYDFGDTWPGLIVALGIYLIWQSVEKESRRRHFEQHTGPSGTTTAF